LCGISQKQLHRHPAKAFRYKVKYKGNSNGKVKGARLKTRRPLQNQLRGAGETPALRKQEHSQEWLCHG
jgi:hypothetical protein